MKSKGSVWGGVLRGAGSVCVEETEQECACVERHCAGTLLLTVAQRDKLAQRDTLAHSYSTECVSSTLPFDGVCVWHTPIQFNRVCSTESVSATLLFKRVCQLFLF